jgi:hypothetical protein
MRQRQSLGRVIGALQGGISHPCPIQTTVTFQKKIRFTATSGLSSDVITLQDIMDLYCFAVSSSSAYQLCLAVRLLSVELYGPMSSSLVPVTVSLEYLNNNQGPTGPTQVFSDTSMGSASCAHLRQAPPSGSLQSMWLNSDSVGINMFVLNGPVNTIVDVSLELVLRNGETPVSVGAAVTGASTGQLYIRSLDSNGDNVLQPVSFVTI